MAQVYTCMGVLPGRAWGRAHLSGTWRSVGYGLKTINSARVAATRVGQTAQPFSYPCTLANSSHFLSSLIPLLSHSVAMFSVSFMPPKSVCVVFMCKGGVVTVSGVLAVSFESLVSLGY